MRDIILFIIIIGFCLCGLIAINRKNQKATAKISHEKVLPDSSQR